MDASQLWMTLLTSVGVRMPLVIAFSLGLLLLMPVAASRARNVARGALAGLLLVTLAEALLAVWPLLLVARGDFEAIAGFGDIAGPLRFVLALLQAMGVVALVWSTVHALRGPQTGR